MKPITIKRLSLRGIRGIKEDVALALEKKSALIYGDNGSGKSSITDALEWFYRAKVDHLSVEEIGRSGLEALRNASLADDEISSIGVKYSDSSLDCTKTIVVKKEALKIAQTNSTPGFANYIQQSQRENLILRYNELVDFILSTKSEKLVTLFDIFGFGAVTNTKQVLKRALSDLNKELKIRNFDGAINIQQSNLLKIFNQNITSEAHFLKVINELIAPFKIGKKIRTFADIKPVIDIIKKPTDSKVIEQEMLFTKAKDVSKTLRMKLGFIDDTYQDYARNYNRLAADVEIFKQIVLNKLLEAGERILKSQYYRDNICPLCLQRKDSKALMTEIQSRIAEIKKAKAEQQELIDLKESFKDIIGEYVTVIDELMKTKYSEDSGNEDIKRRYEGVKASLNNYLTAADFVLEAGKKITPPEELKISPKPLTEIEKLAGERLDELKAKIKDDKATDVVVAIQMATSHFTQIQDLKAEKSLLESQKMSVELIFGEFSKRYRAGIAAFINTFSNMIDEYYQFMNPSEPIRDIRLELVENNDEVIGLSIAYKYLGLDATAPQKYFSESHLNCFGLSLFLASARAFNGRNNFIVMDDVISSFDANHRKRFADLLVEKFSDYQIVLLTHERQWFEYIRTIVQNKNWIINEIKWNERKGAYLDEEPVDLKEKIEGKFSNNDLDDLGSNIRVYLEKMLKEIAFNIRVRVDFRFNESNENRMAYELLSELKGKISKASSDAAKVVPVLERTMGSTFVGNKDVHSGSYKPSRGDLAAFWKDAQEIEALFFCKKDGCKRGISAKYYDLASRTIKCKCGGVAYAWKI